MAIKPMKLLLACSILCCINTLTYSQSEKEIVSKYRIALHKMAVDTAIHAMDLKGDITIQKLTFPISIYYKSPNLLRVEMEFQKLTFLQVSNDSLQWDFNPLLDKNVVKRIDKKKAGSKNQNSSFDFMSLDLLNYKELNHQLKRIGKEKVDSVEVYVLELLKVDKQKVKFFIDAKTFLVYKIEDEKGYRYFSKYSNTDGYVFPRYVFESNSKEKIEIQFSELNFNKTLPDTLFKIPHQEQEKASPTANTKNDLLDKGDVFYNSGQYDSASSTYTKAISKSAENFRAFNSRGLARIQLKEYYGAISDFNRACEINPSSSIAHNNLGLAKYYLGDHAGAIKDYNKALEIEPNLVIAIKNRGYAYKETKKYELAAEDFTKAIKLNATDGQAHCHIGVVLAELEKYEEALKEYELAVKYNYKGADVYNYKGVSEYQLEKYDSAKVNFYRAMKLNPDNLQYLENYGRALYELGDYSTASNQFENYLRKQNDAPEIHNLNGLCKYKDENYKAAIKDFSKSIELNGKEATYYDNRAAAKEMIDDFEGAILDYSESIRIYPNDANVFYKRGMIKLHTSKKMEGCLDLATANEMKFEPAKEAILKNCN
jgi:tetratricopeptide (TPR) repeat protein